MNDDKTNALTDMAWYSGARHALAALSGGMDRNDLDAELEARVAPARKWLALNRHPKPREELEAQSEAEIPGPIASDHLAALATLTKERDLAVSALEWIRDASERPICLCGLPTGTASIKSFAARNLAALQPAAPTVKS